MKYSPNKNREKDEGRQSLRRDAAFKKDLARALSAEHVPESLDRRLSAVYASLPEELRIHRRPWRSALRWGAWAVAALALVALPIFGIYLAKPEWARNLPGMGAAVSAPEGFSALPVTSNGTTLLRMRTEGDSFVLTAEVPFMGLECWDPAHWDDETPFGVTVAVSGEDPDIRETQTAQVEGDPAQEDRFTARWVFPKDTLEALAGSRGLLDVVFFERDTLSENGENRVTAGFTVALDSRTARAGTSAGTEYPSVTPEACLNADRSAWAGSGTLIARYEVEYIQTGPCLALGVYIDPNKARTTALGIDGSGTIPLVVSEAGGYWQAVSPEDTPFTGRSAKGDCYRSQNGAFLSILPDALADGSGRSLYMLLAPVSESLGRALRDGAEDRNGIVLESGQDTQADLRAAADILKDDSRLNYMRLLVESEGTP